MTGGGNRKVAHGHSFACSQNDPKGTATVKHWKSALVATTMLAIAQPALAQSTATAITGTTNAPVFDPDWSQVTRSGANCNSGAAAPLTNLYQNGSIRGRYGAQTGNQPVVARNLGGPFSNNGINVAPGGVILHPANNGDCAILRYTVPATGRGLYTINAAFSSADSNSMNGSGDGVNAMVLINGTILAGLIDVRRDTGRLSQRQVRLCPGDTVDFAVHMKTEMGFDSTNVSGDLQRTGDVSPVQCVTRTTVGTGGGIGGTLLTGAQSLGDPITMTGTPERPRTNCCAPWAGVDIIPALRPFFPGSAAGPYTLTFTPPASLNAQMSAYLLYLNSLNSGVTELTLTWQAADLGTGNSAATSGTTIGAPQTVTWSLNNGAVSMTGGGFWTGAPFPLTTWIGLQTTLSVNGGQAGAALLGPDCRTHWDAWRAQPQQIVQGGGQGGNAGGRIVFESINSRGQVSRTRPIDVRPGVAIETGQLLIRN